MLNQISSYDQVSVGPRIVDLTDRFDTDIEARALVMGYLKATETDRKPDLKRAAELYGDSELAGFISMTWARERCLAVLEYVQMIKDDLLKGEGKLFASFPTQEVATLRRQWAQCPQAYPLVEKFEAGLNKAARGFNIQWMAHAIQGISSSLLEMMELSPGQDIKALCWDLTLVATRGYHDGCHDYRMCAGRAHSALAEVLPPDTLLRDIFELNLEQERTLGRKRMQLVFPDIEDPSPQVSSDEQCPESEESETPEGGKVGTGLVDVLTIETPGYFTTAGGLRVPERYRQ